MMSGDPRKLGEALQARGVVGKSVDVAKTRAEHANHSALHFGGAACLCNVCASTPAPPSKPSRRHELSLKISADTLEDLRDGLETMARDLRETGNQSVGGAPSWGHVLEHVVHPEQTHEKFATELDAWLALRP